MYQRARAHGDQMMWFRNATVFGITNNKFDHQKSKHHSFHGVEPGIFHGFLFLLPPVLGSRKPRAHKDWYNGNILHGSGAAEVHL